MSKMYQGPSETPDYSRLFKNWQIDISAAPHDGTIIMGRITGSNRSKAVRWKDADSEGNGGGWQTCDGEGLVSICQWITFTEFADIRACVWRRQ